MTSTAHADWRSRKTFLELALACRMPLDHDALPLCVRCGSAVIRAVCRGPYTDAEKWTIVRGVAQLPTRPDAPRDPEAR